MGRKYCQAKTSRSSLEDAVLQREGVNWRQVRTRRPHTRDQMAVSAYVERTLVGVHVVTFEKVTTSDKSRYCTDFLSLVVTFICHYLSLLVVTFCHFLSLFAVTFCVFYHFLSLLVTFFRSLSVTFCHFLSLFVTFSHYSRVFHSEIHTPCSSRFIIMNHNKFEVLQPLPMTMTCGVFKLKCCCLESCSCVKCSSSFLARESCSRGSQAPPCFACRIVLLCSSPLKTETSW